MDNYRPVKCSESENYYLYIFKHLLSLSLSFLELKLLDLMQIGLLLKANVVYFLSVGFFL